MQLTKECMVVVVVVVVVVVEEEMVLLLLLLVVVVVVVVPNKSFIYDPADPCSYPPIIGTVHVIGTPPR